jgi:ribosomal protein S27E
MARYVRERLTPVAVKKNTTDFRTGLWLCGGCGNNVREFESTTENKFCPGCGRPLIWPTL